MRHISLKENIVTVSGSKNSSTLKVTYLFKEPLPRIRIRFATDLLVFPPFVNRNVVSK